MKNENVHMQALHCKLDVVLVHILPYNYLETNYSFARIHSPAGLCAHFLDVGFTLRPV